MVDNASLLCFYRSFYSKVHVNRNELINPESSLEIATHSIDTAITVDATLNWWGSPIPGASTVTDLDEYHRVIAGERHKLTNLFLLY
mgnify:FL=1